MGKKVTTEDFIKKSILKHGDIFDYSEAIYTNQSERVIITCKICGTKLFRTPKQHLKGTSCPTCIVNSRRKTTEEWILESKNLHGDKYDYSKSIYKSAFEKVIIICTEHGEFEQEAKAHSISGQGCPKCATINKALKRRSNTEDFIDKAQIVHNNLYDYSKAIYRTNTDKVIITCSKHGEFVQTPMNHLNGQGCPICNYSKGELLINNWLKENDISFKPQFELITSEIARNSNKMLVDFFVKHNNKQYFIEYDGIQHFEYIPHYHRNNIENFEKQQRRDKVLNDFCELHKDKVTLIRFKYTQSKEEVIEILKKFLN